MNTYNPNSIFQMQAGLYIELPLNNKPKEDSSSGGLTVVDKRCSSSGRSPNSDLNPEHIINLLQKALLQLAKTDSDAQITQELVIQNTRTGAYQIHVACVKKNRSRSLFEIFCAPIFTQQIEKALHSRGPSQKSLAQQEKNNKAFTNREVEVLLLIVRGFTSADIASTLNLSKFTIEKHRKNIMKKGQFASSYDLYKYASKHNLIFG